MPTPGNNKFELEALEPRVLLSSTDVVTAATGAQASQASAQATVVPAEQHLKAIGSAQDASAYDPAAHVNNLFDGIGSQQIVPPAPDSAQSNAIFARALADGTIGERVAESRVGALRSPNPTRSRTE